MSDPFPLGPDPGNGHGLPLAAGSSDETVPQGQERIQEKLNEGKVQRGVDDRCCGDPARPEEDNVDIDMKSREDSPPQIALHETITATTEPFGSFGSRAQTLPGCEEQQNQIYADTLIESCRQRLLVKNNILDSLKSGSDKSQIKRATLTKTYLSSRPWMYAPSVTPIHVLLVTVNLCLIVYTAYTVDAMVRLGLPSFSHYKLTALERRDNATAALNPGPGVSAFGMIAREMSTVVCSGTTEPALSVTEENDMLLSLPQVAGGKRSRSWAGFYIVTSRKPGSEGEDPVNLK